MTFLCRVGLRARCLTNEIVLPITTYTWRAHVGLTPLALTTNSLCDPRMVTGAERTVMVLRRTQSRICLENGLACRESS